MKLMIGFAAGFVAGAATYSKLTEQQRAEVAETVESVLDQALHRGRTGDVASTVSSGVGNVADAVTGRVTDATSSATDAVASKIEGDDESKLSEPKS
jgi:acyl-CoA hydrolase